MHKLYYYILFAWYRYPLLFVILLPFTLIYLIIIRMRRFLYEKNWFKRYRASVPVMVVGNFLVGGTGKTPTVIALANWLKLQGFKPGVITRGYGSQSSAQNMVVLPESDPKLVGDEALMIAMHTQCPVIKNKNRVMAAQALASACDVIISDDGLQHYALMPDIKIAMQTNEKWLRNFFCLPAGPWREPKSYFNTVDYVVQLNTFIEGVYLLTDPVKKLQPLNFFANKSVHAVCAIAAPWRFFNSLNEAGIATINHAYPDHKLLTAENLTFSDQRPVLITEKDAVKCAHIHSSLIWVVKVKTELDTAFMQKLLTQLSLIRKS